MASFGDDFRLEASRAKSKPVFRDVGGWRFGLSYGLPLEINEAMYETFVEEMYAKIIPGFDVSYTDAKSTWILSASLQPRGRGSTTKDWKYLGSMVAAVKAPLEACKTPIETTHPNAVHYWVWQEEVVYESKEEDDDRRKAAD